MVGVFGAGPLHAQSNQISLEKIWVNGLSGDRVSLQISGGSGPTAGTSTVGGASSEATARTSNGDRITISESFMRGNASNYDVSFECRRRSNGANVALSGSGLSRTLTIPSGSGVVCTVTNSRKPVSLTLRKQWFSAIIGHAVTVSSTGFLNNSSFASTVTSANQLDSGAATTVYAGGTGQIGEVFTNGNASNYLTELECTGNANPLSSTTLTIHAADSAIICTYTGRLIIPVTMTKVSAVVSDPINGTNNPKMIPGAFVDYILRIANPATYAIDGNSVVVIDRLPGMIGFHTAPVLPANGPIVMSPNNSRLTFNFISLASTTDDVDFSNDGGATWAYTPVANGDGVDPAVTHIRINPKGAMAPGSDFGLRFRVQID